MRIRTKLILLLLAIGLIELVYIDQYWIRASTEKYDNQKQERIVKRVDVLAAVLVQPILDNDKAELSRRISMVFAIRDDWLSITLFDASNNLIVKEENKWRYASDSNAIGIADNNSEKDNKNSSKTNKDDGPVALSKTVEKALSDKLTVTKTYGRDILAKDKRIGYFVLEYDIGYESMPLHRNWEFFSCCFANNHSL